MINKVTKASYDLKKRNDVRESVKRLRRQFLRYTASGNGFLWLPRNIMQRLAEQQKETHKWELPIYGFRGRILLQNPYRLEKQ